MRQKVRITVLKKEFYPEIADAYLTAGREAVRGMVRHKIRAVLGSSGQA